MQRNREKMGSLHRNCVDYSDISNIYIASNIWTQSLSISIPDDYSQRRLRYRFNPRRLFASLGDIINSFDRSTFIQWIICRMMFSYSLHTNWRNISFPGRVAASTYFASRASAKTPAASGAAAEVPEWVVVQLLYKSVVAWRQIEIKSLV